MCSLISAISVALFVSGEEQQTVLDEHPFEDPLSIREVLSYKEMNFVILSIFLSHI